MSKRATLLVLAKMAQADGIVVREEHDQLSEHLNAGETMEQLLDEARESSLDELVEPIDNYADRFWIAYRAADMIHSDGDVRRSEESAYHQLINLLHLIPEDQALIDDKVHRRDGDASGRLEQLLAQSSFA